MIENLNLNTLVPMLDAKKIGEHFRELVAIGIDPELLVKHMDPADLGWHCGTALKLGVDANVVATHLTPEDLIDHLDILVRYHADITAAAQRLPLELQIAYYEQLTLYGAKLDADQLLRYALSGNCSLVDVVEVAILDISQGGSHLDELERRYSRIIEYWLDDCFDEEEEEDEE